MLREVIIVLLIIHGIIHLLGFAKGSNIAELDQFNEFVSKPYGLAWLITCISFIASGLGLILDQIWWVYLAIIAIFISQSLIFRFWIDSRTGTVLNSALIIAILIYFNVQ